MTPSKFDVVTPTTPSKSEWKISVRSIVIDLMICHSIDPMRRVLFPELDHTDMAELSGMKYDYSFRGSYNF